MGMKSSDKLITLQLWKSGVLEKLINAGRLYWNAEDTKEIEGWGEEQCQEIYSNIFTYVFDCDRVSRSLKYFSSFVCPFCVERRKNRPYDFNDFKMCVDCEYGKRHGMCNDKDSDYSRIWSIIESKHVTITDATGECGFDLAFDTKCGHAHIWRANIAYKNLLDKIDSGEITRENVEEWA
jgi:hypothetical protein